MINTELPPTDCEIPAPPSQRFPKLFPAICMAEVRPDGIDIADADAKFPDEEMNSRWDEFVAAHQDEPTKEEVCEFAESVFAFPVRQAAIPAQRTSGDGPAKKRNMAQYLRDTFLGSQRRAYLNTSGQIGVSKPVLEPGGRFGIKKEGHGRIFNWDMWPTLRGAVALMKSWGLARTKDTLDVFDELSQKLRGCIPNVNAPWGATRSQPPVVPRIVRMLARHEGEQVLEEYLPLLERHFNFWNDGADDEFKLSPEPGKFYRRVVRMPNGGKMYRHHDDGKGPRDEMYLEDIRTRDKLKKYKEAKGEDFTEADKDRLFESLRSGAEKAEDFIAADCEDHLNLYTIRTSELVSVKLNALMFEYASLLAYIYFQKAENAVTDEDRQAFTTKAKFYEKEAQDLNDNIHEYCLTDDGFCADYNFVNNKTEPGNALAGVFALGAGVFSQQTGERMLDVVDQRFTRPGGLINTLYEDSDLQWDRNVWPIMQMEAIDAAILYGRWDLAHKWCAKIIENNNAMFARHGVLYEKTDPYNSREPGDQGEYDCVPSLLMTLGVDAALREMLPWLEEMAAKMPRANPRVAAAAGQLATS